MELPAQTPPVAAPTPAAAPAPVSASAAAQAPINNAHSHMNYIALSIGFLIVGLVAGATGGYYFATTLQPVPAPVITETVPAQGTSVNTDTTQTNPLEGVKTNPFQ